MKPRECPHEPAVLAAVLADCWPEQRDGALARHTSECDACGDVLTVARALREDRDAGAREVHVPAAGQVWWRAAVRARLEASQAAARPITWIHGLMGASAVGLTGAAAGLAWPTVRAAGDWIGAQVTAFADGAAVAALLGDAVLRTLPFAVGIAAALVLAPIALYFALSDD